MGVFTYETEFASVCAPARLYNALVLDVGNLIPKIAPQAVKTAEILEGDGGVGTIKKISFGEGSEYSYVKHKVDGIDIDNFVYNYSLIEGDVISDKIEKISYETKLVASVVPSSRASATTTPREIEYRIIFKDNNDLTLLSLVMIEYRIIFKDVRVKLGLNGCGPNK